MFSTAGHTENSTSITTSGSTPSSGQNELIYGDVLM